MTSAERFVTLLVTILTGMGILCGGLLWALRSLWSVKGSWDATNAQLGELVRQVVDLVAAKERDHQRLAERDDRLEARIERHEAWHWGAGER